MRACGQGRCAINSRNTRDDTFVELLLDALIMKTSRINTQLFPAANKIMNEIYIKNLFLLKNKNKKALTISVSFSSENGMAENLLLTPR